jgi:hypothetical protein
MLRRKYGAFHRAGPLHARRTRKPTWAADSPARQRAWREAAAFLLRNKTRFAMNNTIPFGITTTMKLLFVKTTSPPKSSRQIDVIREATEQEVQSMHRSLRSGVELNNLLEKVRINIIESQRLGNSIYVVCHDGCEFIIMIMSRWP